MVPLAPQAVAVLRDLQRLTVGGRFVFPNPPTPDRPVSDSGVPSALRRTGVGKDGMPGHGLRTTTRTLLAERLDVAPAVIEARFAHAAGDAPGRACKRSKFEKHRRHRVMKRADHLDRLRDAAKVLQFKAA